MSAHASPAAEGQPIGFTQVPNAILKANLSLGARLLYSILLSYCYKKDYCYPSYETLMKDLDCGSQALSSYIKELIKHGLIAVIHRGYGKTNLYQLTEVVQPAPAPQQTRVDEAHSADTPSSLKSKEQDLWKSKTEEYSDEKYEDGYPSNIRIAEKEETNYVNFHNVEQGSEEGLKPEDSNGGAVQVQSRANHRNFEKIESRKIAPAPAKSDVAPAKPKSTQSIHVPQRSRPASEETAIQTAIQGYIRDAACKLHDEAPLKSSTTRAYNLYLRSGIQLGHFFDLLYDAEQETMRRSATITKLTAHGFKNRMAYFFAVLEDKLGMRQAGGQTSGVANASITS